MAKEIQLISHTLPSTGSIEAYTASVNAFPVLSADEEVELATRFREQEDLVAAQKLVLSQLRYVVRIAKGYMGYGLQFADLVQEGSVGLMKAVKRFDPSKQVRLVSFAVHWIKSEIHEFVIRNWRIVKVATTKSQRKLFFNLRRNKKRLGWFSQEELQTVAQDLGVPVKDVLEMEMRLNAHDASFEKTTDDNDDGGHTYHYSPSELLESPDLDPMQEVAISAQTQDSLQRLTHGLEGLDTRSRDIVQSRWLSDKKATLKALAQKYDISIERVRQIEKAAFEKIKGVCQSEEQ
jgi:RNA polymerase sigma-32 factor